MTKGQQAVELYKLGKSVKFIARQIKSPENSVKTMLYSAKIYQGPKLHVQLTEQKPADVPVVQKSEEQPKYYINLGKTDQQKLTTELFNLMSEESKLKAFEMMIGKIA